MTAAGQVDINWPTLSPEGRADLREFAILTPRGAMAELSWRGVDRFYDTVFDALADADALGIPPERVRVQRFPVTGVSVPVLSPASRVL